ncbi:hypothetical protein L249_3014 [Ophiocordyceps polyrhachis-furcata BCC 54312]|uniref:Modin n=1 Tax=Ophiocordyceps polyrhachis-furcata BCC 54312 TaxID=1330021 RepID=A0A367LQN2_9HYPO|nr:hypothetical protein L249_3014 [Ophiocordyceps polyrhachis-furcata BCC 54312]
MAGSEPELFVAIAALVVSIVALTATFMQVIQQYYASASGYSKCNERVMGGWAKSKCRRFSWDELRYEVQFEAPVIFVSPPSNKDGPVPNAPIRVLDGTDESKKDTDTTSNSDESKKEKAAKERIHTADNETASWLLLLNAIQDMEAFSREWQSEQYQIQGPPVNHRPPKPPAFKDHHTLAVAVQRKRRTWDTMPSSVSRPYATTTICHLVEMMAVLGVYWKEFDRNRDRYRAEGNGFVLMGERLPDLGLIFSFQLYGMFSFGDNRVIPVDDVKELCFGFVPTIYRGKVNRRRLVAEPPSFGYLQMATRRDISETLVAAIGCNKNTTQRFTDEGGKTAHLFPLSFEILGMIAVTFHINNSCFTCLPNPTPDRWKKKSFSLRKILEAYRRFFEEQPPNNLAVNKRIAQHIQEILSHQENAAGVARLQALHSALDDTDEVLRARANSLTNSSDGNLPDSPQQLRRQMVQDVLRSHIQEVVRLLNESPSTPNSPQMSRFEDIDEASPNDGNDVFMKLYFEVVRQQVVKLAERCAKRRDSFSPWRPGNGRGRTAAQTAANGLEDSEVTPESPDGREMPSLADERVSYDDVWCVLIFRMICWLMLHDFDERDVQVNKSELLGSRMPVYIS